MMSIDHNIWQLAERKLSGNLDQQEEQVLAGRIAADAAFAAAFEECYHMLQSLEHSKRDRQFRAMLKDVHQEVTTPEKQQQKTPRTISLRTHYLRTAGVAAGIALITSLGTFFSVQQKGKNASVIEELARYGQDINTIKTKQVEQDRKIDKLQDSLKHGAPAADVYSSGTGFALTNDGYFVTSYHVVNEADSVYIRTRNGEYYKAYKVAFDNKTDIAVMKVESKNFRFAKSEPPYTFAASRTNLGAQVFTLGFPQDEIAYNEGYVSSKYGFSGDSNQYRLDMSTNPGQSGAPVLDAKGNIVALIAAHEKENQNTTYAVSVASVQQLLRSLPRQMNVRLPKGKQMQRYSREQQIDKMEDYTCLVQVYKK